MNNFNAGIELAAMEIEAKARLAAEDTIAILLDLAKQVRRLKR